VDELARLVEFAERVQRIMVERRLTLSSAESCTGGLFGHVLTEVPGSSEYYLGGIISYSDELKREELGVDAQTLEKHGAVSAQTCVAMAEGARRRYRSSMAVAVTGIAGPAGGSDSKPVGLTYIGLADANGNDVRRHQWQTDRHTNKVESVGACLGLVLERLSKA